MYTLNYLPLLAACRLLAQPQRPECRKSQEYGGVKTPDRRVCHGCCVFRVSSCMVVCPIVLHLASGVHAATADGLHAVTADGAARCSRQSFDTNTPLSRSTPLDRRSLPKPDRRSLPKPTRSSCTSEDPAVDPPAVCGQRSPISSKPTGIIIRKAP